VPGLDGHLEVQQSSFAILQQTLNAQHPTPKVFASRHSTSSSEALARSPIDTVIDFRGLAFVGEEDD